jgi:hypothetical protein
MFSAPESQEIQALTEHGRPGGPAAGCARATQTAARFLREPARTTMESAHRRDASYIVKDDAAVGAGVAAVESRPPRLVTCPGGPL